MHAIFPLVTFCPVCTYTRTDLPVATATYRTVPPFCKHLLSTTHFYSVHRNKLTFVLRFSFSPFTDNPFYSTIHNTGMFCIALPYDSSTVVLPTPYLALHTVTVLHQAEQPPDPGPPYRSKLTQTPRHLVSPRTLSHFFVVQIFEFEHLAKCKHCNTPRSCAHSPNGSQTIIPQQLSTAKGFLEQNKVPLIIHREHPFAPHKASLTHTNITGPGPGPAIRTPSEIDHRNFHKSKTYFLQISDRKAHPRLLQYYRYDILNFYILLLLLLQTSPGQSSEHPLYPIRGVKFRNYTASYSREFFHSFRPGRNLLVVDFASLWSWRG